MRRDRNYKFYLSDIKDSINKIEEYTKDISEEDFKENSQVIDAVIRRMEIIGEAVKNIPTSVRNANPLIPWKEMADFKNLLIHSYFEVSTNRIWKTIKNDLPKIKENLSKVKLL
jgi:uncharacterized protein with HEPN domain